jgi:hypothetical protein
MVNIPKTGPGIPSIDIEDSLFQARGCSTTSKWGSRMTVYPRIDIVKSNYEGQKVNQKHLSALMKFILVKTGNGADRGEIFSTYYRLERRYCGYYTDPCLRGRYLQEYERLYRDKQPVFSKALKRLEERGLVSLIKHGNYIKRIQLTPDGQCAATELEKTPIEKYKRKDK